MHVGGNYNQNQNHGLFYMNGNNAASNKNANIGSRIHSISLTRSNNRRETVCGMVAAHLLVEICRYRDGLVHSLRGALESSLDSNGESILKRVNNLYGKMISDANIRQAIEDVNKSHRWYGNHKPNKTVMWIETTIDERVKDLRTIIEEGFDATEPTVKRRYDRNARKWRDIAEPRLWPDQYVHHILIQTLEPVMMRGMDNFCCGSIKKRGAHYGIKAVKKWMKNDRKGTRWCAEVDIYHFYEQLKPDVVMDRMRQLIKDHRVLDLVRRVLKYDVTIGAYFSQWFANTVLQPLDQIIRECGVSHYIRYMDNFTIFSNRKRTLLKAIKMIREWLETKGLRLKDNWQYFRTRKRYPNALGYRYGHTFTLIRKGRLLTIKRQVKSYFRQRGKVSVKFAQSLLSRLGGLRHCNASNIYARFVPGGLQKKLKNIVREHQRKEMALWSMCLEQYVEEAKRSRTSRLSALSTPI